MLVENVEEYQRIRPTLLFAGDVCVEEQRKRLGIMTPFLRTQNQVNQHETSIDGIFIRSTLTHSNGSAFTLIIGVLDNYSKT